MTLCERMTTPLSAASLLMALFTGILNANITPNTV